MTVSGTVLDGRYRLIAPIAAGGMSVVWRGHDDVLARPIAVKLLAGAFLDEAATVRVRREAMAVARINHPYIANVYDYGESAGLDGTVMPYIVMELVEGESLAQVTSRGPVSWPTAAGICAQVAAGLAAAHQYGVVHRDVTPANVMLCVDGVKIVDFGISAATGQAADAQIFGTPAYLAPERLSGGPAQAATDVYGLGLLLYQLVTGHLPWPADTTTRMLAAHRYVPPAPLPPGAGAPDALVTLCRSMLDVDPSRRPSSDSLSLELSTLARAGDPRARPMLQGAVTAPVHVRTRAMTVPPVDVVAVPPTAPRHKAGRGRPRGMFVLPAVLLLFLVGCLGWASLHQKDQPVTAPLPSPSVSPSRHAAPPAAPQAAPTKPAAKPAAQTCRVNYEMLAQWVIGFTAQVTIVNTGTSEIDGWTLRFALPAGQHVGGGWAGSWDQSGTDVTVQDASYNGQVPVGGSVTVGFLGTQTPRATGQPAGFTLNGTSCS